MAAQCPQAMQRSSSTTSGIVSFPCCTNMFLGHTLPHRPSFVHRSWSMVIANIDSPCFKSSVSTQWQTPNKFELSGPNPPGFASARVKHRRLIMTDMAKAGRRQPKIILAHLRETTAETRYEVCPRTCVQGHSPTNAGREAHQRPGLRASKQRWLR